MSKFVKQPNKSGGEVFKFETVGTVLEGVYLGSFDHNGEYGPSKKHLFKNQKGKILCVFGQKDLTDNLPTYKPGTLMQVTFVEDKPLKKGRNKMKIFEYAIDPTHEEDPAELAHYTENAVNPSIVDEDLDEPTEIEDDEIPADEYKTAPVKAKPAATGPSADRQARVAALLSKGRSQ